jgi:hypothetical protein
MTFRQTSILIAALLWAALAGLSADALRARPAATQGADPLPSWNAGAARTAILDFVARTTQPGGTGFVPVPERIATFDNDGTLWSEQPIYFQFAISGSSSAFRW